MDKSLLEHYAQALFSLGKENDKVSVYLTDLTFLCDVFRKTPEVIQYLDSPMVNLKDKTVLLDKYFKDKVDVAIMGFLLVLIKRKAIRHYQEVTQAYRHCYNDYAGIIEGRVYTPYPLKDETVKKLEAAFSKKYGKNVVFKILTDKRVIAGMKIYVEDTLYDYSVGTELDNVRDKLLIKGSI